LLHVLCLLLGLLLAGPALADGAAVDVSPLQVDRMEDGLYLTTSVRFELPAVVEEALQKGIPMFFLVEADLVRERWYWYDKRLTHATRTLRLAFQPLTRRWRLSAGPGAGTNPGLGLALSQNFESLDEALATLQRISRWKVVDASELESDATYSLDFRFRLDLTQLPRPFQIGVVGQSEWTVVANRRQRLAPELTR
jgi:hypothetical protein